MKKDKVLVATAIFSVLLASAVMTAFAVEPRYATYKCPDCGGDVRVDYSREYQHDETFPCNEHTHGVDIYEVYEIKETEECDGCSYSSSYSCEEHIFKECRGYD